ncbi:MAG: glutamate formimidoyltransferase [bacterium]|nr:glutamate formimidoyltransferase [bacterium]
MELFQCVPNLSEGRNLEVIEAAASAIKAVSGVRLLNYSGDKDHNRSVFTFIGAAEPVKNAVLALFEVAEKHIDLRKHEGAHPRIGAVDVVPFVPLEGTSMEAAIELSRSAANEVYARFGVPVYYYERSATTPERKLLSFLRRGGFESLLASTEGRVPDVGSVHLHERLGASCIGARGFLVAFNVLLDTADVAVAKEVARRVRESTGGLKYVRALGIFLKERGKAQVSMNLVNPGGTAIYTAFEMVKMEARRFGAGVLSSELIGCLPLSALADTAAYYLQAEELGTDRVLERGILDLMLDGSR